MLLWTYYCCSKRREYISFYTLLPWPITSKYLNMWYVGLYTPAVELTNVRGEPFLIIKGMHDNQKVLIEAWPIYTFTPRPRWKNMDQEMGGEENKSGHVLACTPSSFCPFQSEVNSLVENCWDKFKQTQSFCNMCINNIITVVPTLARNWVKRWSKCY